MSEYNFQNQIFCYRFLKNISQTKFEIWYCHGQLGINMHLCIYLKYICDSRIALLYASLSLNQEQTIKTQFLLKYHIYSMFCCLIIPLLQRYIDICPVLNETLPLTHTHTYKKKKR